MTYDVIADSRDRPAWLALRRQFITASDMPNIMGEGNRSALEVYAEKIGAVEPPDLSDVEAVEMGNVLEPVVIDLFRRRTGRTAERCGLLMRSREHPWAACTPDALQIPLDLGPLECKTTSAYRLDEWSDGPPRKAVIQLHTQMLVLSADRGSIAGLIGGQKFVWQDVPRDPELTRAIIHAGEDFSARIRERRPPPPDSSESTARTLARLYPSDAGEPVELSPDLVALDRDLVAAKEERSAVEERIRAAENAIKAAIGDSMSGYLPDGTIYTWKLQTRAEHVVKASEFRVLRRKAAKGR